MNDMLTKLIGSRKAMVVVAVTVAAFVSLYLGKAQWPQVEDLIKWLLGSWLLAQGAEDAVEHMAASKQNAPE